MRGNRRPRRIQVAIVAALVLTVVPVVAAEEADQPFADWRENPGPAEDFLRSAPIVASERIPVGISRPWRLELRQGDTEARASFKSIDIYEQKMEFDDGHVEFGFRDSYRSELAAYRLDRLLGLGIVPPTVAREFKDEDGAVRLWIEGAMTETERSRDKIHAPDQAVWDRQVADVRVFFNLTFNTDYNNINNLLVDSGFRIIPIDHSRAFRTKKSLVAEQMMMRFSPDLLERLEALDTDSLTDALGDLLSKSQIKALLKRRDLILVRADKLIELKGEEMILLD